MTARFSSLVISSGDSLSRASSRRDFSGYAQFHGYLSGIYLFCRRGSFIRAVPVINFANFANLILLNFANFANFAKAILRSADRTGAAKRPLRAFDDDGATAGFVQRRWYSCRNCSCSLETQVATFTGCAAFSGDLSVWFSPRTVACAPELSQ